MKDEKASISNVLCSMALKTATNSVNGKCIVMLHQPKVPSKLIEKYQK